MNETLVLPSLKKTWERFLSLQYTISEDEKNKVLDTFLTELCKLETSAEVKLWCNASNIGNVLSHNFLSEIHHICSSSSSNNNIIEEISVDDHDDLKPLRDYLVLGRGWKILYVVNSIGVQRLSCCRELSNLLISLLPVCFKLLNKTDVDSSAESIVIKPEFNDVDLCFVSRSKNNNHKQHVKIDKKNPRLSGRKQHRLKIRLNSNSSDSEIDVGRPVSPNNYLNQLENLIDTDSSLKVNHSNVHAQECNHREISTVNFSYLVLVLLQKICYRDMLKQNLTTSPPSFTILAFALETLCSIYFGSESLYADHWTSECIYDMNDMILKLVFISAGAVVVQPGGFDVLVQQHNTISVIMRLAQHIFFVYSYEQDGDSVDPDFENFEIKKKRISCVFSILYGAVKLICHITEWLSNRKYCGQVIRLLASLTILSQDVWSGVFTYSVKTSSSIIPTSELLKLIHHVEVIVSTVKRLKAIHIHNSRCLKRRHRKCQLEHITHHHHNILGFPSMQAIEKNVPTCCISYLCNFLIHMFTKSSEVQIQKSILLSLSNCGMCCCLNMNQTLSKLLYMFMFCSPSVRPNIMFVIEKVLIYESENDSTSGACSVCINQLNSSLLQRLPDDLVGNDAVDSAIGMSEEGSTDLQILSKQQSYQSFQIYRELLSLEDSTLQVMICNHLVRITMNGEDRVKQKIFNHVMLPIFLAADSSTNQIKCQNVLKTCLSVMPNLLAMPKNKILFLNHSGVKHLNLLLENELHRSQALKILEILIKSDLDENFDPVNPKSQSGIVLEHKNNLVKKTMNFTAKVNHKNILQKSEELQTRKFSLHSPVLCVFDSQNELIEASGEELIFFTKSEIEHTFNLFTDSRSDDHALNENILIGDVEELKDFWVSAKNLLRNCEPYRLFLSDASNMNIMTAALDMVEVIGSEFHKMSVTSYEASSCKDYKTSQLVKLELLESLLLICMEMTTFESVKQLTTSRQMLRNLKDQLILFEPVNSSDFKLLLEVILHCVLGQSYFGKKQDNYHCATNISEHASDDIGEQMKNLKIDQSEESVGYDADAEFSADHKFHRGGSKLKSSRNNRIKFPEACRLMIDLMVHKLNIMLNNETCDEHELVSYLSVYVQIFQKLNSYCSQSMQNARVMYKQNILKKLLDGFNNVLTINDSKFREFQMTILTTFSLVAKTNISTKELKKILDFFKVSTAPIELLLQTMLTLVTGMRLQPTHLLSFPSLLLDKNSSISECDSELSSDSGMGISPIIDTDGNLPRYLHYKHRDEKLPSPWAAASMVLPLPVDAVWQPKSKSFSFSLWMRMDGKAEFMKTKSKENICSSFSDHENIPEVISLKEDQSSHSHQTYHSWGENLHVLSLGSSQLLFEVWINPATSSLVFRISVASNENYSVLTEATSAPIFVVGLWHYLTVNVSEKHERRHVSATIELNVDGFFDQTISLNYSLSSLKIDSSSYFLIGQSCSSNEFEGFTGIWHLGSLMVFKEKVFTKETSLQMYALGPDLNNLTSCNLGNDTIFIPPHISSSVFKSGINWDILIGREKTIPKIGQLQENLVLIYSAQKNSHFSLYPQTTNLASEVVGSLAQILPVINNLRSLSSTSKASQQQPIRYPVIYLSSRNYNFYSGMDAAIMNIGGISVFIFLFARIVECCTDEKCQADSLRLVLHLLEKNPLHAKAFYELNGYSLILKVLHSDNCTKGIQMLKVLLDSCLSISVLDHEHVSGCTTIFEENEAIITNVDLLSKVVYNWRIWDHNNSELLKILIASINSLLRDNHPFQKFNLQQLQSVYMLDTIILFCKERFYYEEKNNLCKSISRSILKLVANLILTQPINPNFVMSVCDLMLLMHKDTTTYISTTHPGFYYIMSSGMSGRIVSKPKLDVTDLPLNRIGSSNSDSSPKSIGEKTTKQNKTMINDEIKHRSNSIISITYDEVDANSASNVSPNILDSVEENIPNERNGDLLQIIEVEGNQAPVESVLLIEASGGCDEVDRKIQEAEENLSSTVWYTTLSGSYDDDDHGQTISKCGDQPKLEGESSIYGNENPSYASSPAIPVPNSTSPVYTIGSGSYVIVDDVDISFGSAELLRKRDQCSSHATTPEIISSEGEDWDVTPKKDASFHDDENNGHVAISIGLLKILADVIHVAPSDLCNQLLGHVITIDLLLILSHHMHPGIRTGVNLVLSAYISRANDEHLNSMIQMNAFHLLSNQFFQFPVTSPMIDVCFSIILNRKFCLEDPCNIDDIRDLKAIQLQAFVPVLSLLPKTDGNIALCHNIICILNQICTNIRPLTWQLIELGLLESLMHTYVRVLHSEQIDSDVVGEVEQDLILSDVKSFLGLITENVMNQAGPGKFQAFADILHLLSHCERQETNHCGLMSKSVMVLRSCQIWCLQSALDYIQHSLSSTNHTGSSFFRNFSSRFLSRKSSIENSVKEILSSVPAPSSSMIRKLSRSDLSSSVSYSDVSSLNNANKTKNTSINLSDLAERFDLLIQKSCDFVIHRDPEFTSVALDEEVFFIRGLLHLLIQGMASVMERTRGRKRNTWSSVMWSVRDTIRVRLAHLLVFLISPLQNLDQRCYVTNVLAEENKCKEIIKTTLTTNHQLERRVAIFLHDLLYGQQKEYLSADQHHNISSLVRIMEVCGLNVIPPPPNTIDEWAMISEDKKNYIKHLQKDRAIAMQQKQIPEYKLRHKFDTLLQSVSESADKVTQIIALKKNSERKLFIEHIRKIYMERLEVRKDWRNLRDQLCHERGVWFFKELYPTSWQLDPTEGPHRICKRLERCHLNLRPRFFRADCQPKSDLSFLKLPLEYLLEDEDQAYDVSSLLYRLNSSEIITYNCSCVIVNLVSETPGEILVGKSGLHFISDVQSKAMEAHVRWKNNPNFSLAFFFEEIREILKRRFQLQDNAMEIFLTTGRTYLIAFETTEVRNTLYDNLLKCPLPNLVTEVGSGSLQYVTQMWRDGLITNFEYLTQLNKMAGRSFNDLMQYPIFPFVLSEYTSSVLDLLDSSSFRCLGRPMPVQDKSKEAYYVQMYSYLERELETGIMDGPLVLSSGAYHYSSLYSNSANILHFMVRLPPYTSMLVSYQDNNFDVPDRSFHSMETCWRISSSQAGTDAKEIIPEFFYLPEFLLNSEGFEFGVRQSGECVDDVILPNWCRSNARLFILIHRQALESTYVTEHINEWIDLIFGFKQTGKASVDAINAFHPITHFGLDVKSIDDPIKRSALFTMIKTYGQLPKHLFQSRHPMVSLTLNKQESLNTPQVIPEVQGIKWGSYVGSPAEPEPAIVWRRNHRSTIGSFVPLSTNDVFGLAPRSCLIVSYRKEKGLTLVNTTYVTAAALVTWGHCDGILRVKFRKDHQLLPIIKPCPLNVICICATVPDCKLLFVGHDSGRIDIYDTYFDPIKPQLDLKKRDVSLVGHISKVLAIFICRSFSVILSSSKDGTIIIWDLNKLSYVRYFDDHDGRAVKLISVSDTSGDIASVSDGENGSVLKLHTINGSVVGTVVTSKKIHSICFSNAPEGVSVNVIAGGMDNGVIKLWSSWDLVLVTEIRAEKFLKPVVCLVFSNDSQHLYAANDNGTVIIWEKPTKGFNKTPKFLPML